MVELPGRYQRHSNMELSGCYQKHSKLELPGRYQRLTESYGSRTSPRVHVSDVVAAKVVGVARR